jgi:hypothetical protein
MIALPPIRLSAEQWPVDTVDSGRKRRLLDEAPDTADLIAAIAAAAIDAARSNKLPLVWQKSQSASHHYRISFCVPLAPQLFDQFFNGCTGYRAAYLISTAHGILVNAATLVALEPAVLTARPSPPPEGDLCPRASLLGEYSKVFIAGDYKAYYNAKQDELRVAAWGDSGALGRRLPLPDPGASGSLDVKGTFLAPESGSPWCNKADRHTKLHKGGVT